MKSEGTRAHGARTRRKNGRTPCGVWVTGHWSIMISRGGILSAIKTGFANRFLRSATQQTRPKVLRVCPSHSAHPASEKHTEPGVRQHVTQWGGLVQLGRNLRHSPRCGDSPRPRREMRGKNHQNHCLFSLRLVKTGDPSGLRASLGRDAFFYRNLHLGYVLDFACRPRLVPGRRKMMEGPGEADRRDRGRDRRQKNACPVGVEPS